MSPELNSQDTAQKARLLGLAFAGADVVFELSLAGQVTFALGAVRQLTGCEPSKFVGSDWSDLVTDADTDLLVALLAGLKPGERRGPVKIALRPRQARSLARHASLSLFRMTQRDANVSCALSLGAPATSNLMAGQENGLIDREAFMAVVSKLIDEAASGGLPVHLDLVDLEGLGRSAAAMEPGSAEKLRRQVSATLRAESVDGLGATEMSPDRFALVRGVGSDGRLSERLQAVSGGAVRPIIAELALKDGSKQSLRAMRHALDRFIEDGPSAAAATFAASVSRTVHHSNSFKDALSRGSFRLEYQPIVDLKRRTLHHFEALARFETGSSPAETIILAEELGLIVEFDLAVARIVLKAISAAAPGTKIAANVSAASLLHDGFVGALLEVTASNPRMRPRLMIEITETQELRDLAAADKAIAALRRAGHVVCLDDFGAGAASLDYLRLLDVDMIKIDGRYIQSLGARPRDTVVLKHVVAMCRELGVLTVAEMIETAEVARCVLDLGVDLGQGWHFAKPLAEPRWRPNVGPVRARRAGAVEQWA